MVRPVTEYILRAHVWIAATLLPLWVRLFPLKAVLARMTPPPWRRPYRNVPMARIVEIVTHRLRNPRHMKRRACLRLGLALFHFLRLAGMPAVLRIAALPPSRDPRRLHAHCWVSVDGRPVADAPTEPMTVLLVHGGAACGADAAVEA